MYVVLRPDLYCDAALYIVKANSEKEVTDWLLNQGFTEDELESDICIKQMYTIHEI